jgi:hypothetical protein
VDVLTSLPRPGPRRPRDLRPTNEVRRRGRATCSRRPWPRGCGATSRRRSSSSTVATGRSRSPRRWRSPSVSRAAPSGRWWRPAWSRRGWCGRRPAPAGSRGWCSASAASTAPAPVPRRWSGSCTGDGCAPPLPEPHPLGPGRGRGCGRGGGAGRGVYNVSTTAPPPWASSCAGWRGRPARLPLPLPAFTIGLAAPYLTLLLIDTNLRLSNRRPRRSWAGGPPTPASPTACPPSPGAPGPGPAGLSGAGRAPPLRPASRPATRPGTPARCRARSPSPRWPSVPS